MRWFLVPLAAGIGLGCAFVLTMLLYTGLAHWCPGGYTTASVCSTPWVNKFPFFFGGASASALGILLGTMAAPSHPRRVAWSLYASGAAVALIYARHELVWTSFTAVVVGMGVATLLHLTVGNEQFDTEA